MKPINHRDPSTSGFSRFALNDLACGRPRLLIEELRNLVGEQPLDTPYSISASDFLLIADVLEALTV